MAGSGSSDILNVILSSNIFRFFLFTTKGACFLAYSIFMLSFENGLGFTIIINLFSKYILIMFYVPRTKKNQGRLVRQLENEEDIFLQSCVPYSYEVLWDSHFCKLLLPRPLHCSAWPFLVFFFPRLQDYAMQPSSSWIHQSPPFSTILINATQ